MDTFPFAARNYDFTPYVECRNHIGGEWQDAASGDVLQMQHRAAANHFFHRVEVTGS